MDFRPTTVDSPSFTSDLLSSFYLAASSSAGSLNHPMCDLPSSDTYMMDGSAELDAFWRDEMSVVDVETVNPNLGVSFRSHFDEESFSVGRVAFETRMFEDMQSRSNSFFPGHSTGISPNNSSFLDPVPFLPPLSRSSSISSCSSWSSEPEPTTPTSPQQLRGNRNRGRHHHLQLYHHPHKPLRRFRRYGLGNRPRLDQRCLRRRTVSRPLFPARRRRFGAGSRTRLQARLRMARGGLCSSGSDEAWASLGLQHHLRSSRPALPLLRGLGRRRRGGRGGGRRSGEGGEGRRSVLGHVVVGLGRDGGRGRIRSVWSDAGVDGGW